MNERFYTVTPYDFDGEAFTIEGLQPALDKSRELWGGKEHKANAASPAMTLGGGRAFIQLESGCATIVRDDAARAMAKARKAAEQEEDGRTKTFYANATIARVVGANRAEEVATMPLQGEGLFGLLFEAAMFTQQHLGDVPDCMSLQTCEVREASIRAQLSRAKTQLRESTFVNFPGSNTAPFFEVGTRPGEYYRVTLAVLTEPPTSAEQQFPELPRRS